MKGTILVVDDEEVVLKSCERVLKPAGYEVSTSTSAQRALQILGDDGRFDLVITDIKMPGMDGIEFMKKLREKNPDISVVLITGYPSQESIKEALALRVVDYLPKPFSPALLAETAEKAIEFRKKTRSPESGDFGPDKAEKLTEIINGFKGKPGSLLPVLQKAQELIGYLPPAVQRHIARGLNVPVSEVHGVVSFYPFFSMKPRGKHNIKVCLGAACYVKQAEQILQRFKGKLNIDLGEVTADRQFSLETVRCLGACGLAPVVVVDKDTHASVNPDEALGILAEYQ